MTYLKSRTLISLMAIAAAACTAAALPQADANQDGTITRAEFMAESDSRFAKTDTNRDGYLSQDERENAKAIRQSERQIKKFDRLDTNGDGVITRAEFDSETASRKERHKERRMKFMDANKDGQITDEDRKLRQEKRAEMRKERGERSKRGDRKKVSHWERIDSNGDGLISAQEFRSGAEKMFERMDANDDGMLTEGEGRKRRKRLKRRGR